MNNIVISDEILKLAKEAEENLQRKSWWVDKINCLDSIIERAEAKLNVSNRYVHSKKEIGALLNVNPLTLNRWKEGGIINIKRVEREKLPKRLQKELSKSWYYDVFDILLQLKKYQKRKTKSVR